jgi:hypothetical protein
MESRSIEEGVEIDLFRLLLTILKIKGTPVRLVDATTSFLIKQKFII